jgi:hypothetical protein
MHMSAVRVGCKIGSHNCSIWSRSSCLVERCMPLRGGLPSSDGWETSPMARPCGLPLLCAQYWAEKCTPGMRRAVASGRISTVPYSTCAASILLQADATCTYRLRSFCGVEVGVKPVGRCSWIPSVATVQR